MNTCASEDDGSDRALENLENKKELPDEFDHLGVLISCIIISTKNFVFVNGGCVDKMLKIKNPHVCG